MGRNKHITETKPEQLQARDLFVKKGMSPEQISGVIKFATTSTVYRWVKKFGWEKQRMEWLQIPFTAGEKLRRSLESLPELLLKSKNATEANQYADAISKAVASAHKLNDESNRLGAILWAVSRLQKFQRLELSKQVLSPEFGGELSSFLERFTSYVMESTD